jgi:hypothetical protein
MGRVCVGESNLRATVGSAPYGRSDQYPACGPATWFITRWSSTPFPTGQKLIEKIENKSFVRKFMKILPNVKVWKKNFRNKIRKKNFIEVFGTELCKNIEQTFRKNSTGKI